jgi:ATP-binding cassette subfamily B (MDR/TAP) protein 1
VRDDHSSCVDEATSALDATSRVQVFESIKKWRQNRTTIVITHDLSQIIPDDFVYVMKDGVVAEQGFRSDLMAKGPLYGVFAGLAAEQAVQPVPARHEEYIEYEGSFMEVLEGDDDGRPRLGPTLPVNRLGYRPSSTAYYGLLDEYTKGSRQSVFDDGNGGRPMSVAQKRLSWAPRDLVAPRPISRMSFISRPSYGSRPSYEGTPSISIRRPSFDSNPSPYATPLEKDKQLSVSTLSYRHNAKSFHESEEDIKDLKIIVPDTTAKPVLKKHKSVAAIIFSHFPKLPTKHLLIIGIGASVGHGVCTPFWSNYLSNIMAVVGQGGRSPTLTQNTLIVLALSVGQGISNIIQDWTLFTLAANWTAKLRLQAFSTVIAQDRSFFDESINAPSAIMQILIKDIDDMRNLMAEVIGKVVVFVVMVGMGLIWAMIVQWRLTLVGLSVGPALAVTVVLNEAMVGKAEARNKLKREAVAKTFYEVCLSLCHLGKSVLERVCWRERVEASILESKCGREHVEWIMLERS